VSRKLSLALLVLVVVALVAGLRFSTSGSATTEAGCAGVRDSYDRATAAEKSADVATSATYAALAQRVRREAATAPPTVAQPVARLADAYVQLGNLLHGFDPKNDATYHVYEDNTEAIERQQSQVDAALPDIGDWLDSRCS
jgi:hypothetical protein